MGTIILITGGARSGKSTWALAKANELTSESKTFIATAEIVDEEMRERAVNHQAQRGEYWHTIEEPVKLDDAVSHLSDGGVAIIDCCTVWLGNIWHRYGNDCDTLEKHVTIFCTALQKWKKEKNGTVIIVSNEVGWGIVPHEPSIRRYRDFAGILNQRIASLADEVHVSVSGIAMKIKSAGRPL
jgi:adenosylcobinamide kinase/adenosylcobinamide-phosphate guanylyltransferase